MKTLVAVLIAAVVMVSCGRTTPGRRVFTVERINGMTPVKDQGRGSLCWVYAMLATIETDRLAIGDSVNLSPAYVARSVLGGLVEQRYLTQGEVDVRADGVAPMLLSALAEYGAMPYDAYRSECNYDVLCRKLNVLADQAVRQRVGIKRLRDKTAYVLDTAVNPVPRRVWMYGMEYSMQEFARSVCSPADYVAVTSYTHEPFYENVALDLPANREGCKFYNVPVDTLVSRVEKALRLGNGVCWEGDVTNDGFSFEDGVACLDNEGVTVTQDMRQRAFERFSVTDDHCMELVGLVRDQAGRRYFVCKNSWGTDNPYGGLMYMSLGYFRLNTVAVVMKNLGS